MIITSCSLMQTADRSAVWNSLRRFQNVSYVASRINALQGVSAGHARNVRKQAEQVRYCLVQAAEYFQAADAVSLATKPLLLYYGIMSLALAELLFKQDGGSSLDAARGDHAHHGLTLKVSGKPNKVADLKDSAAALVARPLIRDGGERFGTFELWHRSSRETAVCGKFETMIASGGKNEGTTVLLVGNDWRMPLIPSAGMSLLECFRSLPAMIAPISECGIASELVRVRMRTRTQADQQRNFKVIVQPTAPAVLAKFLPLISFRNYSMEQIQIREMLDGAMIDVQSGPDNPGPEMQWPNSFQPTPSDSYFATENQALNEFGVFYLGMYILGNYARYFPEQWMADVEAASDLATSSEAFIASAQSRVPVLALSELSRTHFLV